MCDITRFITEYAKYLTRDDVYLCIGNKGRWEFIKERNYHTASKQNVQCEVSTILFVPFYLPRKLHGMYLSHEIKNILNPCKKYVIKDC